MELGGTGRMGGTGRNWTGRNWEEMGGSGGELGGTGRNGDEQEEQVKLGGMGGIGRVELGGSGRGPWRGIGWNWEGNWVELGGERGEELELNQYASSMNLLQ